MDKDQVKLDRKHNRNAQELKKTLETKGWKEIIKPILDKMISDTIGFQKQDGEWEAGSFGDKMLTNVKAENLLWYRQALIEFNNHVYSHFRIAKGARKRLRQKENKKEHTMPMKDTNYYNPKEPSTLEIIDPYSGGSLG